MSRPSSWTARLDITRLRGFLRHVPGRSDRRVRGDATRLKTETAPIKKRLAQIERPQEVLDVEAAVNYLRDVGSLWAESPRNLQREFVREVFQRIGVEGKQITTITPHSQYAPLFVLDRRERFGQVGPEFCSMAPGTGLEPVT